MSSQKIKATGIAATNADNAMLLRGFGFLRPVHGLLLCAYHFYPVFGFNTGKVFYLVPTTKTFATRVLTGFMDFTAGKSTCPPIFSEIA
jgi:hypothetical protein